MARSDAVLPPSLQRSAFLSAQTAINSLTRHIEELERVRENIVQASQERNSAWEEVNELRQKVETLEGEVSFLKDENDWLNLRLSKKDETVRGLTALVRETANSHKDWIARAERVIPNIDGLNRLPISHSGRDFPTARDDDTKSTVGSETRLDTVGIPLTPTRKRKASVLDTPSSRTTNYPSSKPPNSPPLTKGRPTRVNTPRIPHTPVSAIKINRTTFKERLQYLQGEARRGIVSNIKEDQVRCIPCRKVISLGKAYTLQLWKQHVQTKTHTEKAFDLAIPDENDP